MNFKKIPNNLRAAQGLRHGIAPFAAKTRRDFLRLGVRTITTIGAAAAFGEAGLVSARAQPGISDYKALVCIFLFGGNDANNMLIPNEAGSDTTYSYHNYQ